MYNKNLAMAVKVDGKVLREIDGKVYLPFGAEYTIYFKNTSTRRVKVKITIDGQDAMDGTKLVIDANSTSELKRFIKNGNMTEGNSFKFIEKTEKISQHRGDRIDDGLIVVEYEFEREQPVQYMNTYWPKGRPQPDARPAIRKGIYPGDYTSPPMYQFDLSDTTYSDNSAWANASMDWSDGASTGSAVLNAMAAAPQAANVTRAVAKSGITAAGSHNSQQFSTVSWRGTDSGIGKASMTLELKGEIGDEDNVEAPVTIKTKVACYMCGSEFKSGTKFCSECGTSLKIY